MVRVRLLLGPLWERACVGGGLPPMAVIQSKHSVTGTPLSGASPLPHKLTPNSKWGHLGNEASIRPPGPVFPAGRLRQRPH
ncbi:hypothetical protein C1Y26_24155 [Pseudomonas sp. MPR-R2A7]|nr:hypothetical protein C1Y23_22475 [Pseudomonas sp. GW460-12]PMX33061.1 hypothetical protein C1Y24_18785 [Pseudomonas sp. MPR-R2A4]PMX37933.1 hypothetical protein C1Y26_24155 [Pseudomonas sp. MPR-R2A7]PMX52579.1 hypothetical protein C1Y17_18170 [Pseudomonas sp. MPR-R2A6]PMX86166.1 hypothetical protein C1Y21_25085 [Pseudomonas sp. MPR-R2A3]PMY11871.1 hypothetical protein C1Y22_18495 [Pseudomonas sp. MPR-R2A5]PNA29869.1 hypothetical protein C1Y16_23335 [Pseudomonas sp. MPR-ANB1]PNA45690.1 hyp